MPWTIKPLNNGKYQLINKNSGRIAAKSATMENIRKMIKIIAISDSKKAKKNKSSYTH